MGNTLAHTVLLALKGMKEVPDNGCYHTVYALDIPLKRRKNVGFDRLLTTGKPVMDLFG